jgi:hypothetical protein
MRLQRIKYEENYEKDYVEGGINLREKIRRKYFISNNGLVFVPPYRAIRYTHALQKNNKLRDP